MIDYITLLNDEELKTIVELMSGKAFKFLFQKESKNFAKIKPGFRPTVLSDNDAVSLAIKHIKKPFISSYVNFSISNWLKEIQESIEEMESQGLDKDDALALTLMDSYFCDNLGLYFIIVGEEVDNDYIEKLRMIAERKRKEDMESLEHAGERIITTSEVEDLKKQLADREKKMKDHELMFESQLQAMREDYDSLKKALEDANQRIQELNYDRQKAESEIASLQARVRADDSEDATEVVSVNDYDYISFCEVQPIDINGKQSNLRLADINRNGNISPFYENEDIPKRFGNRKKLFMKNGPSEPGAVGVWKWRAVPNIADPTRDFIESEFVPGVSPIKIIVPTSCKSVDELLEILKTGIEAELSTSKSLFSIYCTKGQYVGFLCHSHDFEQIGTKIKLVDTVMSLPRYEFSVKDTVRLPEGTLLYRSISIGIPSEVINIRNPLDIVKTVIISRNSWQIFKQKGKTRSEWKSMRDLLEGMDTESVIDDIVHAANCSNKEAQYMLDEFIKHATDYIDGNSIEDNIIAAVIAANPDLMERCKNIIMEDWIAENLKAIEEADKTIEDLKKQIEETKAELEKEEQEGKALLSQQKKNAENELASIKNKHDSMEASLRSIEYSITAKEQLAKDVEAAVEKRIRQAQTDAADFIAGLAFAPQVISKQAESSFVPEIDGYIAGSDLNSEDIEENASWVGALDTISFELKDAGVANEYALPLAAFMYAAYLNRYPLIIIGPNASAIVDAFSGALFCRTAGTLECTDEYSAMSVTNCISSNDNIVKIINMFSNNWVNRIPEITSNHEKYFIAVHPFTEDTLVEPKSLYSYMLPVFTEMFVEKDPTGQFVGGKRSSNYKEFRLVEGSRSHRKLLLEMHAPLLVRTRIQTLLSNMHAMLNNQNTDYDVLFALLPYAFATMQMPQLLNAIKSEEKKNLSVSKELLDTIVGMYGGNE